MKRLTFEGNFCDIAQCDVIPGGSYCKSGSCTQQKVWEQLKAYEDTGLTPEDVSTLVKDWTDLCTIVGECGGISRVRVLAEADKDGRVVVRPYRLGAEVYVLLEDCAMFYPETNGWYIGKETIGAITPDGFYLGDPVDDCFTPDSEVGKTVFLTREKADEALEAMQNE